MKRPIVLVVVGPTSSGKSDLGVLLAKKFDGEVISADSRQVYRGLDIGSGKITSVEMKGIPHHLLDVASPKRTFTVSQYQKLAKKAIKDILRRGNVPILVGGTGFYIGSIVDNFTLPEVPPNQKLRKELAKKSAAELLALLQDLDPERAATIDTKNPRRLLRAIEIATALGSVPKVTVKPLPYEFVMIGLKPDDETLKGNIHKRLHKRIRQGMIAEVQRLHDDGLSWKRLESFGLEYRFVAQYLQGKITKQEMIQTIEKEHWHYVKRQLTWFKRDSRIKWLASTEEVLPFLFDPTNKSIYGI